MIHDIKEREHALDPTESFIVQAPAGSGKTELLTQRFLVLLSRVKQPEEIIALTFTKKAAAEMRSRIINALQSAMNTPEPALAHAKKTWMLAKSVLQHDKKQSWHLLDNPNRLRCQTIDSLNASLTRQLPILSHFGATPDIADDPTLLYTAAVDEFLSHLEDNVEWSKHIAQLLQHLDNDLEKLKSLIIHLFKKRDQWLPYMAMDSEDPELRDTLESNLASINRDILSALQQAFPKENIHELLDLYRFSAQFIKKDYSELIQLPGTALSDKAIWLSLIDLLLTKENTWRKRLDKTIGFPSESSTKNAKEKTLFSDTKQRMMRLINLLSEDDVLQQHFSALRSSPAHCYTEAQWAILKCLHPTLCVAVAQLKLTFQQNSKIDYIESAEAALMALGTDDAPTDITLALDYKIQHLLVDEFQDTSRNQYRLLEKLTAGWELSDGRTLFLVGDPMQSIYRFREADVGLFIRTRQHGLNHISLTPLTLSVNFRSVPSIVDWINTHFKKIFPAVNDAANGAISYSSSTAALDEIDASIPSVELNASINAHPDNSIVDTISAIKKNNPSEKIAILVRSRTHLITLIPALKKAAIPYRAMDIDKLDTRPVIQDLMALTRALLQPTDRTAWLALLRAPWCGLSLDDLWRLTADASQINIWTLLQSIEKKSSLSAEAQHHIARLYPILKTKIDSCHRLPLRLLIESTWIALGGPACVPEQSDLEDATVYFNLLEKWDKNGELEHLAQLEEMIQKLYAAPQHFPDDAVQIMTIHNAKGLEFDTVILPYLDRPAPDDKKQLLLWSEYQAHGFILAPLHATEDTTDSIYRYIQQQNAVKNDYESRRLFYVAATRARKKLHLFFSLKQTEKALDKPRESSLLAKCWNTIEVLPPLKKGVDESSLCDGEILVPKHHLRTISRLKQTWANPIQECTSADQGYHDNPEGFELINQVPRQLGIALHRIFQQFCEQGTDGWQATSLAEKKEYLRTLLLSLGCMQPAISSASGSALKSINNLLTDPRGQWIIQPHMHAKNEYPITTVIDGQIQSLVIDRTFIDENNIRWIIDYKTGEFSDKESYQEQLSRYKEAIQSIDSRPIRLGLYFPLIPLWMEYQPTAHPSLLATDSIPTD